MKILKGLLLKAKVVIHYIFSKKRGTLVYLGLHKGDSFMSIFHTYEKCYAFEADPLLFEKCRRRFKFFSRVHILNVAVADYDGEIDFNISSNSGASSSIGNFSPDWENYKSGNVKKVKTIKTLCINLLTFLHKNHIDTIEDYISDIQGFDLQVLKTLKPLIDSKKINNITAEVAKNEYGNIYRDLPDNSEDGFNQLLGKNYECVSKGWGILENGKFDAVPDEWWEMDCKWKAKA